MIPSQTEDIHVESTVQGEKIAMSFDENSLTHLMTVLTDLYSDPEMAVLREYSTNARDSHIEAGQSRPIEVTLPSALSPFLHIKDFGIGLNQQDIEEIYSKYGASTKRETNDQTGVLGLGCKSALTYSAQFSLVGIKQGIRTMVSIARDEDGAGSMTIVENGSTDEPNGVEVIIPVRRSNGLVWKAQELFRFWEPGTVLVNGEEPTYVEGTKIDNNILMCENLGSGYIVMGGVPYPVSFDTPLHEKYSIVLFADIGDVNFTPSREALQYTRRTKERILQAQEEFREGVKGAVQRDINEADSAHDAFHCAVTWRKALPHMKVDMTYQQQEIPQEFIADEGKKFLVSSRNSPNLSHHDRYQRLNAQTIINGMIVYGYNMSSFTAAHKKKLKMYAQQNGLLPEHFILTEDRIESIWLDPSVLVDWEKIRAIRIVPEGRGGGVERLRGSFDIWEQGNFRYEVPAEEIDGSLPLFYFTTHDFKVEGRRSYRNMDAVRLLTKYFPDCTVVVMGNNRVAKFCREFPKARSAQRALIETYNKLANEIPAGFLRAYTLQRISNRQRPLSDLDETQIDDPELVKAIELTRMDGIGAAVEPLEEFNILLRHLGISDRLSPIDVDNPFDSYPLLENLSWKHEKHPHIYLYINAVYQAIQAEKE